MRYVSNAVVGGLLGAAVMVSSALAQNTQKNYDKNGNFTGQISREGSRDVERDPNGNRLGYYEKQGDRTVHRDPNGNFLSYSKP